VVHLMKGDQSNPGCVHTCAGPFRLPTGERGATGAWFIGASRPSASPRSAPRTVKPRPPGDSRAARLDQAREITRQPTPQASTSTLRRICECRIGASGGSAARFGAGDRGVTHERSGRPHRRALASTCPLWSPAPTWPTGLA
jgi:hypothetical protein